MSTRVPIFIANWKMNKLLRETGEFVDRLRAELSDLQPTPGYEVVIAPPATHLWLLLPKLQGTGIAMGAQNCGPAKSGAFTGELSPAALSELGCGWVILGHSERRHVFREDNGLVAKRVKAALDDGLKVVLCVGETSDERKAGRTFAVVEDQLSILKEVPRTAWDRLVVAYEPVWAIGTGETASPAQAEEVQAHIRKWVAGALGADEAARLRILYGGSVKPDNAQAILAEKDVDGFLVGGASLEPGTFAGVIKSGLKSRT